MDQSKLKQKWLEEQEAARIRGWDFSHISGRYDEEQNLPWNYEQVIRLYLKDEMRLLDIDTGGGEFLLSLCHPYCYTSATEGYPPNVRLCEQTLLPLEIDFREMHKYDTMPFEDNSFDMVINRHGNYDAAELYRVLKPNGLFITQQVGSGNDRELIELLCPGLPKPFPTATLKIQTEVFRKAGFIILRGEEAFRQIRFYDIGALVWFARIIEWEFRDFCVERSFDRLLQAQRILKQNGSVDGTIHRYLIVAKKCC